MLGGQDHQSAVIQGDDQTGGPEQPPRGFHRSGDNAAESQGDRAVFTVEEAASLVNISKAVAYDLADRGDIPPIRPGRRIAVAMR